MQLSSLYTTHDMRLSNILQQYDYITPVITAVDFGQFSLYNTGTSFLPRDAMHKRGLCCHAVSVRLSVCLSRS